MKQVGTTPQSAWRHPSLSGTPHISLVVTVYGVLVFSHMHGTPHTPLVQMILAGDVGPWRFPGILVVSLFPGSLQGEIEELVMAGLKSHV
jgi:hypothetical protein